MEGERERPAKEASPEQELAPGNLCPTCAQPWPERDDVKVAASALRCPYCHDSVDAAKDDWIACEGCLARHHASCWKEAGACGTCRGKRGIAAARSGSRLSVLVLGMLGLLVGVAVVDLGLLRKKVGPSAVTASDGPLIELVRTREGETKLMEAVEESRKGANPYYTSWLTGTHYESRLTRTDFARELQALSQAYEKVGQGADVARVNRALQSLAAGGDLEAAQTALRKDPGHGG